MEMMREELGRMARNELGRVAADAVEEYFPQEAKARRRRSAWRAFLVGLALGVVGRYALRRQMS